MGEANLMTRGLAVFNCLWTISGEYYYYLQNHEAINCTTVDDDDSRRKYGTSGRNKRDLNQIDINLPLNSRDNLIRSLRNLRLKK